MPLVRIDAIEGRSKDDIKNLLDAVHRAIVSAFAVPQRDRYQIYQEHSESTLSSRRWSLSGTATFLSSPSWIGLLARLRI